MSEFQYYLKRYPQIGEAEGGSAYLEDDGRMIIHATNLRTMERKTYEYDDALASAADGWMLD